MKTHCFVLNLQTILFFRKIIMLHYNFDALGVKWTELFLSEYQNQEVIFILKYSYIFAQD